jgi:DNA-binding protein HU-alpha
MAPNAPKVGTPIPTAAKSARPAKSEKAEKPARAAKPAKAAAERPAPAAEPAAKPVAKVKAKPATDTIKIRNLVDTVATATGAKKPDAKIYVEAVLAAIGAGLAAKSVLVVPPLGKLRVAKSNGPVLTLKLRLADTSRAAGLALAEDDEDS